MAEFKLTAPDGTAYKVTADTPEQAYSALQKMLGAQQQSPEQQAPEQQQPNAIQQAMDAGYQPVAPYRDGMVMEKPGTQERMFVSPGYVTTNPQVIEGIMQGVSPSETGTAQIQGRIIEDYPVAARAATALQGVPFVGTYVDEAVGQLSGPDAMTGVRNAVKAMEAQRPLQAVGLQVGGALASLPLIAAATPAKVAEFVGGATSLAGKAVRGAAVGTGAGVVEGGTSGYGRGEGDNRLGEAQTEAAMGGVVGLGAGAAVPLVSAGIAAAWRNIKGRSVSEIAKKLNISPDAAKVVRISLENDDIAAATAALDRAGSSSMLADAGPGVRQLLDASITSGGKSPRFAREAVDLRAEESGVRMKRVMDDLLGPPQGVETARQAVREGASPTIGKEYRRAYAQPIDYSGSRGKFLEALLKRVPRSAINDANELMNVLDETSQQILMDVAADGTTSFRRLPDVRQWDYITRGLNSVANKENGLGKLGGTTPLGRAYGGLSTTIRGVLRDEVPEYSVALSTAADAIRRSESILLGADILKKSTTREEVARAMKGATAPEKAAARSGFRSAVDDFMAEVNAVASDPNIEIREFQRVANKFRSRAMQDKMELLLGKSDADRLYKELDESVVSLELRAAIARNSATQQRLVTDEAVQNIIAPNALQTLMAGDLLNAGKRIAKTITGNTPEAKTLRSQGIYDEIAGVLVGLRGRQAQEALGLVRRAIDGDALTETQARVIARALTMPAAAATYTAGTEQ